MELNKESKKKFPYSKQAMNVDWILDKKKGVVGPHFIVFVYSKNLQIVDLGR